MKIFADASFWKKEVQIFNFTLKFWLNYNSTLHILLWESWGSVNSGLCIYTIYGQEGVQMQIEDETLETLGSED